MLRVYAMDVYFATWIFYGTTSGSGSGFTVRRRSGCAEPSSRACAINAGSLRHARPQHRMSVQLDFCRANRTVAMAPATTVIKPPSSLILNGSIDIVLSFFQSNTYDLKPPDFATESAARHLCPQLSSLASWSCGAGSSSVQRRTCRSKSWWRL